MSTQLAERSAAEIVDNEDSPFGGRAVSAMASGSAPGKARTRLLVVEDERALTDVLTYNLEREGYEVVLAHDGQEGLRKAQSLLPDLIVLDVMLPIMSGLDVCRELRSGKNTREIPIILLTAKSEETDQLIGFSLGADDYVTKPFSVKVLLQRLRALQRRTAGITDSSDVVEHGGVSIDRMRHKARVNSRDVDLTPTEFKLLECMLRQPGRAFSRPQLLDAAIGDGTIVLERTVDVHIKTLRRKLGDTELIETVRGVGYRFKE